MRPMARLAAVAASLLLAIPAPAAAQQPVQLSGTVVETLDVEALPGVPYQLYIAVPEDAPTGQRVPALYLLDAYDHFGMVLQTYRLLRLSGEVPPLVLVGISYGGTYDDYVRIRTRDFTPTHLTDVEIAARYGEFIARFTPDSGGGEAFLRLLREGIIPFVESCYPVLPDDRTLFGYSYGGLFSAYVLFTEPGLFNRYLVGSSAIWWHDDELLGRAAPARSAFRPGTRAFVTAGADEGDLIVGAWQRLSTRLSAHDFEGVETGTAQFPGEHHLSAFGITYSRALRWLFRDWARQTG